MDARGPPVPHHRDGVDLTPAHVIEIACDESGSEGENLLGGETDVFAHAGVRLGTGLAADCVQEIRDRIRSPALEYKANHLLRQKHRQTLVWLLGPASPLHGHAHVQLVEKEFFAAGKLVELLVEDLGYAESIGRQPDQGTRRRAVVLYRDVQRVFGRARWVELLESFVDLMRAPHRGAGTSGAFFRAVESLHAERPAGPVRDLLDALRQAGSRADSFRTHLVNNPQLIPALDPLAQAILLAVDRWSDGAHPVALVHDEQPALRHDRLAQLAALLGPSASVRFVDSRSDPRVQLADFLAGVARWIASEELNDRGDAELTVLLRPYVDPSSIWGDARSWALLG